MSTKEQLEKAYQMTINAVVALNSQWIFSRGDCSNPLFVETKKRLDRICSALELTTIITRDGDDTIITIETIDHELVLSIRMNLLTFEDEDEENVNV